MDEIGQHLDQALAFYDHAMNALSPGERQSCPPGQTRGEAGAETGEAAPPGWLRHLGLETGLRTSVAARKILRYVTWFTHVFVRQEILAGDSDFCVIIGIVGAEQMGRGAHQGGRRSWRTAHLRSGCRSTVPREPMFAGIPQRSCIIRPGDRAPTGRLRSIAHERS